MKVPRTAVAGGVGTLVVGLAGALVRRPWHDELYTLELARRPARAILEALVLDSGPPGHYLLAHVLSAAGLEGILWVRLLSVLSAAAAVAVLAVAAHRRWGERCGWLAAGLLAVHPVVLLAAVEARAYGILLLCGAAAVALLRNDLSASGTVALGAALALACWVHSLGLVLCFALLPAGALLARQARLRTWAAAAAALALHLPWIPVMARQPAEALEWMARVVREGGPRLAALPLAAASPLVDLSPWLDIRAPLPGTWWAASLLGLAALLTAAARTDERPLALLWGGAGAVVLAASFTLRPVYFPGRGDALWVGAAALLMAALLARLGRMGILLAAILVLAGGTAGLRTLALWRSQPEGPAAQAAHTLASLTRPGDLVITTGWWGLDVRWAMGREGRELEWRTFPPAAGLHPGWYSDREADPTAVEALLEQLAPRAAAGRRIWLLRSPPLPSDRLLDGVVVALGLTPRATGGPLWQIWGPSPDRCGGPDPGQPSTN